VSENVDMIFGQEKNETSPKSSSKATFSNVAKKLPSPQ
jgi:hypothetical protein